MELHFSFHMPETSGKVVEDYLKTVSADVLYPAWTIDPNFKIVPCLGIVTNNSLFGYHQPKEIVYKEGNITRCWFPEGEPENELYVVYPYSDWMIKRWFCFDRKTADKVLQEQVDAWIQQIQKLVDDNSTIYY